MVEFVEDVPRDNHRRYDWGNITSQLKANPGKWAIIEAEGVKGTNSAAQATSRNIRKGRIKGLKPGEYDAMTRGSVVYARYVCKHENKQVMGGDKRTTYYECSDCGLEMDVMKDD